MVDLRRAGRAAGLKFMQPVQVPPDSRHLWHLADVDLSQGCFVKTSIEFVKRAMHHKREATTFGYITFIEHTQAKIEVRC